MTTLKDYGSRYYVTSDGKVFTKPYMKRGRNQSGSFMILMPEKELKGSINNTGYRQVRLDGKLKSVHVVVAECFLDNPENKPEVNHIDGVKSNCSVSNLEWVTRSENLRHAYDIGLNLPAKGSSNGMAKLTEETVKAIYLAAKNKVATQVKIGIMFGVPQITVSNIKTKKSWSHVTDTLD